MGAARSHSASALHAAALLLRVIEDIVLHWYKIPRNEKLMPRKRLALRHTRRVRYTPRRHQYTAPIVIRRSPLFELHARLQSQYLKQLLLLHDSADIYHERPF